MTLFHHVTHYVVNIVASLHSQLLSTPPYSERYISTGQRKPVQIKGFLMSELKHYLMRDHTWISAFILRPLCNLTIVSETSELLEGISRLIIYLIREFSDSLYTSLRITPLNQNTFLPLF